MFIFIVFPLIDIHSTHPRREVTHCFTKGRGQTVEENPDVPSQIFTASAENLNGSSVDALGAWALQDRSQFTITAALVAEDYEHGAFFQRQTNETTGGPRFVLRSRASHTAGSFESTSLNAGLDDPLAGRLNFGSSKLQASLKAKNTNIPEEVKAKVALDTALAAFSQRLNLNPYFAAEKLGEYIKKRENAQEAFAKRYHLTRDQFFYVLKEYVGQDLNIASILSKFIEGEKSITEVAHDYMGYQLETLKHVTDFAATLEKNVLDVSDALDRFAGEIEVPAEESVDPDRFLATLEQLIEDLPCGSIRSLDKDGNTVSIERIY